MISGFKAYVVPSWKVRPGNLFSVLIVKTGREEDTIVVRSVEFGNDGMGIRSAALLAHPPGVDLFPEPTPAGVVNAVDVTDIPKSLRLIPVVSGDLEREQADINLKTRFMMVNSLEGHRSLAEHHHLTEDIYGEECDDASELLDRISMRVCKCLASLGLLPAHHSQRRIDWKVISGLRSFLRRCSEDDCSCEYLTPELLKRVEDYLRNWQNALLVTSFGYLVDVARDPWRLTVGLIQAYNNLSVTLKLDEATARAARKLISYILQQGKASDSARSILSKVLDNG